MGRSGARLLSGFTGSEMQSTSTALDWAFKVTLSGLAVALFGAVGLLVARGGPLRFAEGLTSVQRGPASDGPEFARALPEVPVPPDTELTFTTSTEGGRHRRYESRLSTEGLWLFYANEMPRSGWRRDRHFDSRHGPVPLPQPLLSFKAGGARCIIGLEQKEPFATVVNVLVIGASHRKETRE